jgi:hypothetical protein
VEIVANLRAHLDRAEPYERLTVDGAFIAAMAIPSGYSVVLDPLIDTKRAAPPSVLLSSRLRVDHVPNTDADWSEIGDFALTFPGWTAPDIDWDAVGQLVEEVRAEWMASGRFPTDMDALRVCLLWEQRRLRHWQTGPGGEFEDGADELPYAQALVSSIRDRVQSVPQ